MRAYIAGPLTGIEDLNFPLFQRVAAALRAKGIDAVNPAEINPDPSAGWQACMKADLAQLVTCDAVVMLPRWQFSRGARLESHVASQLGLQVLDARKLCPECFETAEA